MKIASIVVFICLILVPIIVQFIFLPILFTRSRNKQPQTQPKKIVTSNSRNLIYSIVVIYGLLTCGSTVCFLSETLNLARGAILFIAIIISIAYIGSWFFVYKWYKYLGKVNPVPKEGFTPKTRMEWLNNYNKLAINVGFKRALPIIVGLLILGLIVGLVAGLLFTK
jgi:ribose/xylose/arabinose/galactoside ABC-type transport system permease subunit